jgi:hypothetical protein
MLCTAALVLAGGGNFSVHLKGRNEVPANPSKGQGQAIFHLSDDETRLEYRLIVADIDEVTQAHIHCGAAGVNGPVVVFLFGPNPAGVTKNGTLAEGTITASNVIPRDPSAACPGGVANLADVVAKIKSGDAYVNVHTIDLPPGEIRGQFR